MIFIALFVSWLALRFSDLAKLVQIDDWFDGWRESVAALFDSSRLLAFGAAVLLPVLLLGLLLSWFGGWFFGLVEIGLNIAVMLFACGRYPIEDDIRHYRGALQSGDASQLHDLGATHFGAAGVETDQLIADIERVLSYRAYENWFAPACWFLLLGAPGALFYRLLHICERVPATMTDDSESAIDEIRQYSNTMVGWFDFVPARIWSVLQALVSDFASVFATIQRTIADLTSAACYLVRVQNAALDAESGAARREQSLSELALRRVDAIERLTHRTMIAALIFVAVVFIAF